MLCCIVFMHYDVVDALKNFWLYTDSPAIDCDVSCSVDVDSKWPVVYVDSLYFLVDDGVPWPVRCYWCCPQNTLLSRGSVGFCVPSDHIPRIFVYHLCHIISSLCLCHGVSLWLCFIYLIVFHYVKSY